MYENLFNHININTENINIPNGMAEDIEAECDRYDESIKECWWSRYTSIRNRKQCTYRI